MANLQCLCDSCAEKQACSAGCAKIGCVGLFVAGFYAYLWWWGLFEQP